MNTITTKQPPRLIARRRLNAWSHTMCATAGALTLAGFAFGPGASTARAQATGIDVSRYSSWTAEAVVKTSGQNTHGTASNPTAAVWSYYRQDGVSISDDGEGGTIKTGITTLTSPTTWTPVNYVSGDSLFNLNTTGGRSRVRAFADRIQTYWNVKSPADPNDPPPELRPAWIITTYRELSIDGGVYDIGGKLSWQLDNTASPGNLNIVIAKISVSGDVSVLFNTTTANVGLTGTFTVFDQAEGTLPESLTGIVLAENEQLAFAIRGSAAQHRSVYLVDQDLTLTLRTTQVPEPAHATLLLAGFGALMFIVLRRATAQRKHTT
ncbi:hypothetical protein OPIT5_02795 [Opitutaceae bacterium TAV5]|nr:hypothetical protein OPIT5_02795 [Opitutaceae bacterium TAV5]